MMQSQQTPETSVLFSLAELAEIEQERIREEEQARAEAHALEARAARQQAAQERAGERARAAADEAARAQRVREQQEAQARTEAHMLAARDVARIEAEAKARLEADNAARAHELAVIRARTERTGRITGRVLGALLGVVLCAGAAAGYHVSGRVEGLERDNLQLHEQQRAWVDAQKNAARRQLESLDRRHRALRDAAATLVATNQRDPAGDARRSINEREPTEPQLAAFRDALDGWTDQLQGAARLALLDQRQADLLAWADGQRKGELVASTERARARAHGAPRDGNALAAYERSLDEVRGALERPTAVGAGTRAVRPTDSSGRVCTSTRDPLCGFDGKPL